MGVPVSLYSGPPVAGNGERLKENMYYLSAGDVVRERVLQNDELAAAGKCLDASEAVSADDLCNYILAPALQNFSIRAARYYRLYRILPVCYNN